MEPVVVAVLVGIVVYFAIVAAIPKSVLAESSKYTRSMLRQLETESANRAGPETDTISIMREHISKSNLVTRVFFTMPGVKYFYPKIVRAGLSNSLDKFFMACLGFMLLAVYVLKSYGFLGALAAIVFTYMFAGWVINGRIRKRNEAFLNGFPDALDMIVRSVRSGYPLNAAVRMVSENMQAPISTEFKQVADEAAYGSPLVESLQRLSFRIDEPDIRFFVVVLSVQQEVGGNLAEVLSNLAGIIRRRKHLRLKVKAMTSEGRATSWVLGLLPVFVFCLIHFVTPRHLDPFFQSHFGNLMLAGTVALIVTSMAIVRKMVNVKV